jgi:hypothetical protein
MRRQRVVKLTLAAGMVGLLILPALVYTQVTGRVLNPRLRQSYPDLQTAVNNAGPGDTLLVSGTLSGANASANLAGFSGNIVAGRGLRGTLSPGSALTCPPGTAVIDASDRNGPVSIIGLKIEVPNGCVGVLADAVTGTGGGNPLTVQGVLFTGATAAAVFTAIETMVERDGPFNFTRNTITGRLDPGISLDGDGTNAIQATIFGNRITNTGIGGSGNGIDISDVPAGSSVTVERNRVEGGNNPNSVGIRVLNSNDVIVRRNTVRNFVGTAAPQDAFGIGIGESPNTQVLRNVIANNDTGVGVNDNVTAGAQTANTVVINDNNITSTVTGATGLLFIPDSTAATAPLDATNNWWGANTGPGNDGDGDTSDCCTPTGSGLPVVGGPGGCGTAAGTVTTCPFRTAPVSPAGA